MRINKISEGFYDPSDDVLSQLDIDDTRSPKLTLRHINKLRKMREAKKLDLNDRKKFYKDMYRAPEPEQ